MAKDHAPLHILFFPVMAQGHLLPTIDMVKLFASRGVKCTILSTPANSPLIHPSIDRSNDSGGGGGGDHLHPIHLHLIPFPSPSATGLPPGCENVSSAPPHLTSKFFEALAMFRDPFAQVLRDLRPDCVVTGMFFPWTVDVAAEFGIPRIVFHGSNFFSRCAMHSKDSHNALQNLPAGAETLVLPGLPHRIEMLVSQLRISFSNQMEESEAKSYGVIVNSFYELEPDYVEYFKKVMGRRAWHVGPMLLCSDDITTDKSPRGTAVQIDHDACLKWLDGKRPGSVLYVCFGSASEFTVDQLRQIALGLEASNCAFIWGARKVSDEAIPEGFEERVEGRGMVIRGWAPQLLILNHAAVGGFLTHCGWNSALEGVSAGLPFVTWPLFADQFFNERLIVDLLKIGVAVGATKNAMRPEDRPLIEAEQIGRAVDRLMGEGEEAAEMKRRAMELGASAKKAVKKGGSSYVDMSNLIQELKQMQNAAV